MKRHFITLWCVLMVSLASAFGSDIVINEVLARNVTAAPVEGKYPSLIELRNTGTSVVDVGDMSLTDDGSNLRKFVFPPGTLVAPGGYIVVCADGVNATGGGWHAGFLLRGEWGAFGLVEKTANGGGLTEVVVYGPQVADLSIGRQANGQWGLTKPTLGNNNIAIPVGDPSQLKINECLTASDAYPEGFVELYNPGTLPIALGGLSLSDSYPAPSKSLLPALSFIGAGPQAYAVFKADGNYSSALDSLSFKLSATSGSVRLYTTNSVYTQIDSFFYSSVQRGVSQGRLPDGSVNILRFTNTVSRGVANYQPLTGVVISEVLTHVQPPLEQAIEIQNISESEWSIGGWYLGVAEGDLKRYRIPRGVILPPGGFYVIHENEFGARSGTSTGFKLDAAHGGELFLSTGDAMGNLTGFHNSVKYGPAADGISQGRYSTILGADFVALNDRTLGMDGATSVEEFRQGQGATNSLPLTSPVVINEVHYHSANIDAISNPIDNFVELFNASEGKVQMYDPDYPTNAWRLRGGIQYDFPTDPEKLVIMRPGTFVLLVNFDPATNVDAVAAFRDQYSFGDDVLLLGPYSGELTTATPSLELYRPDSPLMEPDPNAGFVPYLLMDRAAYSNYPYWPAAWMRDTNGMELSLQRVDPVKYGGDPLNWFAGLPTPGNWSGHIEYPTPVIVEQPQSINTNSGSTVVFAVKPSDETGVVYQWRCNGELLPGETNSSLTLISAQPQQSGWYSVLVCNNGGSTLSDSARLDVSGTPWIVQQPESQMVAVGGDAMLFVGAGGGALSYHWLFNGTRMIGETNHTLLITNAQMPASGLYTVEVSTFVGSMEYVRVSSRAVLSVMTAPAMVADPAPSTIIISNNAAFSATVSGTSPMTFEWRWNGNVISSLPDGRLDINGEWQWSGAIISSLIESHLYITNAQPDYQGEFQMVARNFAGSVTSQVAQLTVVVPPTVQVVATDPIAMEPNKSGIITFTRTGPPTNDLNINFSVGGTAVSGTDYVALPTTVFIPMGASSTNLLIAPIDDTVPERNQSIVVQLLSSSDYFVGVQNTAVATLVDDDNQPASIRITSPVSDQVFIITPTNILITVEASDPDGSVALVEYFSGTNKVGQSTTAPFSFVWTNAAYGSNELVARVTDNLDLSASSSPVRFYVNAAPLVEILTPYPSARYSVGANVPIEVSATDPDGTVMRVDIYDGSTLLTSLRSGPYSVILTKASAGRHNLRAEAVDDAGMTSVSRITSIIVAGAGIYDDFDPDIDRSQWSSFSGTVAANNNGGCVSGAASLWFGGSSPRYAITRAIDVSMGGLVAFDIRIAHYYSDQDYGVWAYAYLPDEGVVAEYSVNGSTNWVEFARFDTADAPYTRGWVNQQMPIPYGAQSSSTQFRWRQLSSNGSSYSHWALDNVQVAPGPLAPILENVLTDQSLPVGSSAHFVIKASGSGPLNYQWRLNGASIPGETNYVLNLDNVTIAQAGDYSVFVSNEIGSVASVASHLTVIPMTADTFQIGSLGTNNARVMEHSDLTGYTTRGGIGLSSSSVFVTGDTYSARYSALDLMGGARLGKQDALVSDLKTGKIYVLANDWTPLTRNGGIATTLVELDPDTGALTTRRVVLSASINCMNSSSTYGALGIFSGYGRIAIHNLSRGYSISLPSGLVTDLGTMSTPNNKDIPTWAYWGVVEYFNGTHYLTYVLSAYPATTVVRTRVPDGLTTTVTEFDNLGYIGAFVVSPDLRRWYFDYSGQTQFGSGNQLVGFADAVIYYPGMSIGAPKLVSQPESVIVAQGAPANLSVNCAGSAPLAYQWQFNEADIPNASHSSLIFNSIQQSQAGRYRVIITNASGSITSYSATVTVALPVVIHIQPQPQTIVAGSSVAFTVAAEGTGPISYQWMKNGTPIFGQTGTSFVLTNTTYFDNGGYSVAVSNAVSGVFSDSVNLLVLSPPVIIRQPNRDYLAGMNATLQVDAVGTLPIFYQWRKDGVALTGLTNATFTLANVQASQAGNYQIVLSNAFGVITSSVITLGIPSMDPNTFVVRNLTALSAQTVNTYQITDYDYYSAMALGATRVLVNGYSTAATYQQIDLSSPATTGGSRMSILSDLKARKAYSLADNSGMLTYGGTATRLLELDDYGMPTTNQIQLSQSIYCYSTGGLFSGYRRCVVLGQSRAYEISLPSGEVRDWGLMTNIIKRTYDSTYNWADAGSGVVESLGTNLYLVYVQDSKTIVRTRLSDQDTTLVSSFTDLGYMCSFTVAHLRNRWYFHYRGSSQFGGSQQTLGYAAATFGYLIPPADPPQIVDQPQSVSTTVTGTGTFKVLAIGAPPLSYQWYRNDAPLSGQTSAQLSVLNVHKSSVGNYYAVVANNNGATTSAVVTLSVDYPPLGYITNSTMPMNNTWRYSQTSSFYDSSWAATNYVDSTWSTGRALLYADPSPPARLQPRNTLLTIGRYTYYFRTTFVVNTNAEALAKMQIRATTMMDDGGIIFINGRDVQHNRFNNSSYYYYYATGAPPGDGHAVAENFTWPGSYFVPGTNYIAAEVHNVSTSDSDICWGMSFSLVTPIPSYPPTITNQPVAQYASAGDTVTFSVGAWGTEPMTYQWMLNGRSIQDAGAKSPTLVLTNIQYAQIGNYSVVVRNANDNDFSVSAPLVLSGLPRLVTSGMNADRQFGLNFYAVPGNRYVLETTTNLFDWDPLAYYTNSFNGQDMFVDPDGAANAARFYRLRQLP